MHLNEAKELIRSRGYHLKKETYCTLLYQKGHNTATVRWEYPDDISIEWHGVVNRAAVYANKRRRLYDR